MMRILWITNGLFPEANARLQGRTEIKGTGGWLLGLANALIKTGMVEMTIAGISSYVKDVKKLNGSQIIYYAIPTLGESTYKKRYEEIYQRIFEEVQPDVVHIHGTEFPHSLAALRVCGAKKTVVSLQGLASIISRYYLAGLTRSEIRRNPTFHDFMRQNLYQLEREMEERGRYEIELFKEAVNVIGRTNWDRAHVWAVNPRVNYYHCDEILRQEFYEGNSWSYDKCVRQSVFLSQGNYPLKGLHKALEALSIVKCSYPSISIRIAGLDITKSDDLKSKLKLSTYGRIVKTIIKKNDLSNIVSFLGPLNAEGMKKEYLRANVFICPSSIENSPNSLCEAQILGTPVVASYAGGVPDLMKGDEEHLYRYDEVEMLAEKVCRLFDQKGEVNTAPMRTIALMRHDVGFIVKKMLNIYNMISHN